LTGYYEIADLVESARNSGIWKATLNRTVADAAMSTGGARIVTSATASFTSADIGRTVAIAGAGVAGATYYGVIKSVSNATTCAITNANPQASVSVTGAAMSIVDVYTEDGTPPARSVTLQWQREPFRQRPSSLPDDLTVPSPLHDRHCAQFIF
jgi:hypothetical protein